jgi:hypothetical protein
MKTFFKIIGVIFGLFILSLVFISVAKFKATSDTLANSNKEAQVYVDRVIPQIVENWNAEKLISEASHKLLSINTPENIRSSFSAISNELGKLREYKGSEIYKSNSVSTNGKIENLINIKSRGTFEKATVEFDIVVTGDQSNWRINEFNVKKLVE